MHLMNCEYFKSRTVKLMEKAAKKGVQGQKKNHIVWGAEGSGLERYFNYVCPESEGGIDSLGPKNLALRIM